jgi:hypothetical protein
MSYDYQYIRMDIPPTPKNPMNTYTYTYSLLADVIIRLMSFSGLTYATLCPRMAAQSELTGRQPMRKQHAYHLAYLLASLCRRIAQ